MNSSTKIAVVTGASMGIGADLAELLAADGYDLVLVARSETKLLELADKLAAAHGVKTYPVVADLADASAPAKIMEFLEANGLNPVVLVNNAGVGLYGRFSATPVQREVDMIQINITSLTHLAKLCLPYMLAAGTGHILNVASTAAFQPGPLMAVYYATKAYVLSFSEALNNELKGTGVSVTALCPGPTRTGFVDAAGLQDSRLFKFAVVMTSLDVARIGYKGMKKRKAVVIPGIHNWILTNSVRLLPRAAVTSVVRLVQDRTTAYPE